MRSIRWNGTMFDDLDWPLNASRRFVSISRASCYTFTAESGNERMWRSVNIWRSGFDIIYADTFVHRSSPNWICRWR